MSVSQNYADHTTTFECDECGDTFEADGFNFHDAYEEYKDNGGIARNVGDKWEHRCRDCR
jgi:hypothetical protein